MTSEIVQRNVSVHHVMKPSLLTFSAKKLNAHVGK